MIHLTIASQDSGKKLHRFLRQTLPGLPLSGVHKMIRVGRVKVNGVKGKLETILNAGDDLSLYIHDEEYQTISKPRRKFSGMRTDVDVVYEDEHLLVLNKPVGLLTHPDSSEHKDTLINQALAYLHEKGEIADGRAFLPATVNRLDRNTSGIVLIGKDGDTLRSLAQEIRERQLEKSYLAVVWGLVKQDGEIETQHLKTASEHGPVHAILVAAPGSRTALTKYEVLGSAAGFSLLKIELITGRMHQIRAHMQSIGHPLLGDIKYGGKPAFDITHQLLHAWTIVLPDGRTFRAPLPEEFHKVLQQTGLHRYFSRSLNLQ